MRSGREARQHPGDLRGGLAIARRFRRREPFAKDVDRLGNPARGFEHLRLVESGVGVGGIGGDGAIEPGDRFGVVAETSVLLRDRVEAEGVVGLGVEELQELGEARGGVHDASVEGEEDAPCLAPYAPGMVKRIEPRRNAFALLTLAIAAMLPVACFVPPPPREFAPPPPPRARLVDLTGGSHRATLVANGRWYCGLGSNVLVVDLAKGRTIRTVELREAGEGGPVCDLMIAEDGRLLAVLEDTAVVELEFDARGMPEVALETDAATLGLGPRWVREIDGVVYVGGMGGIVPLAAPGAPRLAATLAELAIEEAAPLVETADGLAAPTGRRVHRIEDGRYLGAATALVPLPEGTGTPGALAFVLQGRTAAEVGLMTPDLRVTASHPIPGTVRSLRVFNGKVWVVDDEAIVALPIDGESLGEPLLIRVLGALEVARVDDAVIAVCGHFGRALYRLEATPEGPGDTFFAVEREPSDLRTATHDGRIVVAAGPGGTWRYEPSRRAEIVDPPNAPWQTPKVEAKALWGVATIDPDGMGISIDQSPLPAFAWSPEPPATVHTLLAVGNSLWVGHGDGIDLLRFEPIVEKPKPDAEFQPGFRRVGTLRFAGPVRFLFPQRVGTAVNFVSEFGGFGVVDEK